jgi:hypothetical protein
MGSTAVCFAELDAGYYIRIITPHGGDGDGKKQK